MKRRRTLRCRRLHLSWPQRLVYHKIVMANGASVALTPAEKRSARALFRNRRAVATKEGARLASRSIYVPEWRVTVDWKGLDWTFRDLLARRLGHSDGSGFFFGSGRYDMDWSRPSKAQVARLSKRIRAIAKSVKKRVRVRLSPPTPLAELYPLPSKDGHRRRRRRRYARLNP